MECTRLCIWCTFTMINMNYLQSSTSTWAYVTANEEKGHLGFCISFRAKKKHLFKILTTRNKCLLLVLNRFLIFVLWKYWLFMIINVYFICGIMILRNLIWITVEGKTSLSRRGDPYKWSPCKSTHCSMYTLQSSKCYIGSLSPQTLSFAQIQMYFRILHYFFT